MSSDSSAYLIDAVGIPAEPEQVAATVVARVAAQCDARLPLLPGAVEGFTAVPQRPESPH